MARRHAEQAGRNRTLELGKIRMLSATLRAYADAVDAMTVGQRIDTD